MKINPQRTIACGLLAACGMASVSCTSAEFGNAVTLFGQAVKTVYPNDPEMSRLVDGMLMLSAIICSAWAESEVQERAAYATSVQYVEANQRQLNTRLSQAKKANRELSQVTSQKNGKLSAQQKKKAKEAINKNVKLIDKDLETARQAQKEAKGAELDALRQQIDALSKEKQKLQKNSNSLSALSSI